MMRRAYLPLVDTFMEGDILVLIYGIDAGVLAHVPAACVGGPAQLKRILVLRAVMTSETAVLTLTVNGEETSCSEGSSILDVVEALGFDPLRIAVEIDGSICPRSQLGGRKVRGGERMEVVSFVGGG